MDGRRLILQIPFGAAFSFVPDVYHASICGAHLLGQKRSQALRGRNVRALSESDARLRKGRKEQAIPGADDLAIAPGL